ncbi:MAG: urease accessory protein UreF [Synechococcus sp. SB0666_bin_14]|nr:urease accessory protein UreF [Synechococcus sp. SB0666_bin_14]MYG46781.1 urease accessory protein UreF [Synechococcus sp. SB0675_bin_6]MYJ60064.1 urease accessory protein UreF [Synechococcus sp. SB0672_bin_6]
MTRPDWPSSPPCCCPSPRQLLWQLASPTLPVGSYTYSEGLETMVQQGRLQDVASLECWLTAELNSGAVRVDAATINRCLLAQREGDWATAQRHDAWLLAQRSCGAMRRQQRQMGRSMLVLLRQLTADGGCPLAHWPDEAGLALAWSLAGERFQLPVAALLEAFLFSWSANLVSAAVRLVPLAARDGQQLQLRLQAPIAALAAAAPSLDPQALWPETLGPTMAQLGHDGLYSRLFRS